ncbi:integrase arm-type DNA-binding domain-containing protein [Salinisphaera sp. P385]|uniref:Integrase arm-type DNA-binding domain-containing protein n=1 Tax=Spectribacter acetivorans TaxID=3075603 RepID=A0ABU3BBN0_9GAMM|nr:integrase arm-type DNA-binding domain-containing protein [Salinisphaera sp. P385]MDT0619886.1 integrase arm-type DNA-binding domain-containing protein [Salinisphaera sp. P385]
MEQRLTDRLVKAMPAPATRYRIVWDEKISGFGVRVTKSGAKSFVLNYRVLGRERRYTIGPYPAWSVAAARERAGVLRRMVDTGIDPMEEREARHSEPTLAEFCDRFLNEHVKPRNRSRTHQHYAYVVDKFVRPALGTRKITAIKNDDVRRLHRRISEGQPVLANRVVAVLSTMFNVAIRWGVCEANPAKGIDKNHEAKRERYLSADELRRVCKALSDYPYIEKVRR